MKHLRTIAKFVDLLHRSSEQHGLFIKGPRGVGKSTIVEAVLREKNLPFRALGTHATPLGLYNALSAMKPGEIGILDDTGGLFEGTALDVLKASLAPAAGSGSQRLVAWTSTTTKASVPEFLFEGKLIIVSNVVPNTSAIVPLRDRCYFLDIQMTAAETVELLRTASLDRERYPNEELAAAVLQFLTGIVERNPSKKDEMSLRTFAKVYEIALLDGDDWQETAQALFPLQQHPNEVFKELTQSGLNPNRQAREFVRRTGMSERAFWYRLKDAKMAADMGMN